LTEIDLKKIKLSEFYTNFFWVSLQLSFCVICLHRYRYTLATLKTFFTTQVRQCVCFSHSCVCPDMLCYLCVFVYLSVFFAHKILTSVK